MKPIGIGQAKKLAIEYDYDQIIIIARRCGDNGGEHVTTYGRTVEHCKVAAHIGNFIKYEIMKWEKK